MKVLFLFNHPAPYKVDFFNELSKYVEVTALFERKANSDRDAGFYKNNKYNFKAIFLKGLKIGKENSLSFDVIQQIKNNQYDLIIINGWRTFTEMRAINYLKRNRKPYAFYINGGIAKETESALNSGIKNNYISGADLYFSPDETSNIYLLHYGARKEQIVNYPYSTIYEKDVLRNPLSFQEKVQLRKELSLPEQAEIVISVGQFIERKNYFSILNIWSSMPTNRYLVLLGGGKLKIKYESYIKKNHLKNVIILPFKSKDTILKYMRASDLFIFPSLEDIYGHVINEALTQGLPVISSMNVNAAKKLIENGYNGFVYKLGDDKDLICKIDKVLSQQIDFSHRAIVSSKDNTIENMATFHAKAFKEWVNKE